MKKSSGLKRELQASIIYHSADTPLLISDRLLRDRGMGQVDLARFKKSLDTTKIEIAEVKSSLMGEQVFFRGQNLRLSRTQTFLSGIFGLEVKLIKIVG